MTCPSGVGSSILEYVHIVHINVCVSLIHRMSHLTEKMPDTCHVTHLLDTNKLHFVSSCAGTNFRYHFCVLLYAAYVLEMMCTAVSK